jgi:hypothetical protein
MTSAVQTPLAQGETSSARRVMDGTLRVPRLMGSRADVVASRAAREPAPDRVLTIRHLFVVFMMSASSALFLLPHIQRH